MNIIWHVELIETDPNQFGFFASGHHKSSGEGRTYIYIYIYITLARILWIISATVPNLSS